MHYTYTPRGVCSRRIDLDIDDTGVLTHLEFLGGCNGNLQGVSALAVGRPVTEVIPLIRGIRCGSKGTSCPDQLSQALTEALDALRSAT